MKIRRFMRGIKLFVFVCGVLLLCITGAAFTALPWKWYGWLAEPTPNEFGAPDYIVMMGGGGIPSESGLTRAWKTAEVARLFTNATVIVAMPAEEELPLERMVEHELAIHGISMNRIVREPNGRNTREQALEVYKLLEEEMGGADLTIGLVSSPEHMRRVWASFKSVGFKRLNVYPSWAEEIEADLDYEGAGSGGDAFLRKVGIRAMIRYRIWDNLIIMGKCNRETFALMYYQLLGWD